MIMASKRGFTENDRLRDMIEENSAVLPITSRFGIPLGFGDNTVSEICIQHKIDSKTFISVCNFTCGNSFSTTDISVRQLIEYLKRAHAYFLDYCLPMIRRRLIEAIDCSGTDDIANLVIKFYDEYALEVKKHMSYEDNTVFKYVTNLLNGLYEEEYSIRKFADKHNSIATKLKELKDIIIRYYPGKENDKMITVLFDIMKCEQDLASHCEVEDRLFVPAVEILEDKVLTSGSPLEHDQQSDSFSTTEQLSNREKEIVACIAKGMTTKEIAETLFLSTHTVNTHRRNICSKLQIHSPAGLTIYAIINKLVRIDQIKAN